MRVIPPVSITSSILTSSTVIESTPAVYAGGTTYALDAIVYVGTIGQALAVYKSLQGSNTGHTPASSPTWWKSMGNVYAEYAGGTTYALGDTAQVAATHKVYESLAAGNTGNAVTDATKWLDLGATNKMAMFDLLRNTKTVAPLTLTAVLTPGQRINSLFVGGMVNVNTLTVTATSVTGGGTVFNTTVDLNTRSVIDAYTYCFEPFSTRSSYLTNDIPPYSDIIITITLTATSGNVECGSCVIGTYEYIGDAVYEAISDTLNFSTVTRDIYGNSTLVQRRNVPKTNQTIWVDKSRVNRILAVKELLNATPAVWSALDDYTDGYFESLLIVGIYKTFTINAAMPDNAKINLELEEV